MSPLFTGSRMGFGAFSGLVRQKVSYTITTVGTPGGLESDIFDNDVNTAYTTTGSSTSITINFNSVVTANSTIKVYATHSSGSAYAAWNINSSSVSYTDPFGFSWCSLTSRLNCRRENPPGCVCDNSVPTKLGWYDLTGWTAGTITSMNVSYSDVKGLNNVFSLNAIEIDGVILT